MLTTLSIVNKSQQKIVLGPKLKILSSQDMEFSSNIIKQTQLISAWTIARRYNPIVTNVLKKRTWHKLNVMIVQTRKLRPEQNAVNA